MKIILIIFLSLFLYAFRHEIKDNKDNIINYKYKPTDTKSKVKQKIKKLILGNDVRWRKFFMASFISLFLISYFYEIPLNNSNTILVFFCIFTVFYSIDMLQKKNTGIKAILEELFKNI